MRINCKPHPAATAAATVTKRPAANDVINRMTMRRLLALSGSGTGALLAHAGETASSQQTLSSINESSGEGAVASWPIASEAASVSRRRRASVRRCSPASRAAL